MVKETDRIIGGLLGEDTDTTAAVAGGLAGILYGRQGIPEDWINALVRKDMVCSVIQDFADVCYKKSGRD